MMSKDEIRSIILANRQKLRDEEVQLFSEAIIKKIKDITIFKESKVILSYMAYGNEVNLMPLNQFILDSGKRLCLPRVLNSTDMDAAEVDSLNRGIVKSKFGILEPSREIEPVETASIDMVLVPGLAFDMKGNRIGHGKGYYDRFLSQLRSDAFTLGIAYNFQVFENIPFNNHDKKVKGIVSETQLYLNL